MTWTVDTIASKAEAYRDTLDSPPKNTRASTGFIDGVLAARDIYVPETDTFPVILTHFVHCVTTGQESLTNGTSQRHALSAVMAAYRSMKNGQPDVLAAT